VTWLTEVLYRDVEDGDSFHSEEHEEHGEHDEEHAHHEEALPGGSEWGLYSQVIYTFGPHLDAGARIGYVDGDSQIGTLDRYRISPVITAYLDPFRRVSLRAQYNYDDIEDADEAHSFWLQLGLAWGGPEVR
jgi:hypothetical protein